MRYQRLFDPYTSQADQFAGGGAAGDWRDGRVYVYTDAIVLAVNVAMATLRPLLVRGPSGSGKSSLARHAARVLGWRYYERVISSRTQAQDLLWEVDHLRRLQDAQAGALRPELASYVRPGVLWWAFDRAGARRQAERAARGAGLGATLDPNLGAEHERAVVLLDEIDKADPDVPNNLLVPLGSLHFQPEGEDRPVETVAARAPLVFLTTNDERDLPAAFLRRCVELKIESANADGLIEIGRRHFPYLDSGLLEQVAELVSAGDRDAPPSAAEYLDTVRACHELAVSPGSAAWENLLRITVWKHGRGPQAAP